MLSIKNSLASVLLLVSYAAAQSAPGQSAINLEVKYCSKENTGSSNAQGENIYQTLGLCNDHCQGKFTYAVLQYQECWCSNDKPSETVDVEDCNQTCPGYPDQKCGNKGAGLYSYVPLDGAPISSSNGTSLASSAGSVSPASTSNSTMPGSSTVGSGSSSTSSNSTSSAGGNGNGHSGNGTSSDGSDDFNSASSSLSVSALGAAFGFAVSCAFAFAA